MCLISMCMRIKHVQNMSNKENIMTETDKNPDTNCWFVFIIVCMATMLYFGIIFTFGAMFVDMMETFESERSSTATIQSLLVGISLSFSVVSGALISKFELHVAALASSILVPFGFLISFFVAEIYYLYITISVISGIGIATTHEISVVVIQQMFPQRLHPICFAIHSTGVNFAGILYPFLIERLLDTYGVHGTFLTLGGLFMNSFASFIILSYNTKHHKIKGRQDEKIKCTENTRDGSNSENESDNIIPSETEHLCSSEDHMPVGDKTVGNENALCDKQDIMELEDAVPELESHIQISLSSLLTKQYIFLLLASAMCIPAINTFQGFTVDIFVWKGFSVSQGLFSFVPFNVFSLLSNFIPVLAKKYIKRLSCFVLPMCFCIIGILSQLLVYVSADYITMLAGTSLVGLSFGGVVPAMFIAGAKIVSRREWPVASGLLMTVIGVVSSGLGPVFGSIRDRTGTYTPTIITIGILQAAGALFYMLALISRKNEFTKKRLSENLPQEMSRLKEIDAERV
ncbi:monocarboxylate transporter 2-like [Mercenaria mercenaria]|uniref:monocarboxylate transporter 2-like n=1 Tax=Mercenaria mercenaria TaxID=6596 RepID=UPI00234FAE24|nr:monocarboxylate transporter 2-like [Mercenaria mercenaria]XP_053393584.1 monocarboxylate transporter 2-like [Mercenaria mercenaria]XP_053393585.1 monocarboxylate transporter 2-like [Mercenaria mercenaria]